MAAPARRSAALGAVATAFVAMACGDDRAPVAPTSVSAIEIRRTPPTSVIAEYELADIAWATDSTFVAAIDGGSSIVLVRWDGSLHRQVARKGDGPGEVRTVFGLARSGNELFALDANRFRVLTWTHDGELKRDVPFEPKLAIGMWMTERGLALKVDGGFGSGVLHFDVLAAGGDSAGRLSRHTVRNTLREPDSTCFYCPSAVSRDGTIASSASDTSYRILRWRADGTPLPPIERPELAAIRRTQREVDSIAEMYEDMIQRFGSRGRMTPRLAARLRESARQNAFKRWFLGRSLVYDDDGRLWVQRQVGDGDSAAIDVFDRRAQLIGIVRLPRGIVMHRANAARILASTLDDEGVLTVLEYRVDLPTR